MRNKLSYKYGFVKERLVFIIKMGKSFLSFFDIAKDAFRIKHLIDIEFHFMQVKLFSYNDFYHKNNSYNKLIENWAGLEKIKIYNFYSLEEMMEHAFTNKKLIFISEENEKRPLKLVF